MALAEPGAAHGDEDLPGSFRLVLVVEQAQVDPGFGHFLAREAPLSASP